MTLFTDSPYEKMMIQKPDRKRQTAGTLKGGFFIDFTYLSNR